MGALAQRLKMEGEYKAQAPPGMEPIFKYGSGGSITFLGYKPIGETLSGEQVKEMMKRQELAAYERSWQSQSKTFGEWQKEQIELETKKKAEEKIISFAPTKTEFKEEKKALPKTPAWYEKATTRQKIEMGRQALQQPVRVQTRPTSPIINYLFPFGPPTYISKEETSAFAKPLTLGQKVVYAPLYFGGLLASSVPVPSKLAKVKVPSWVTSTVAELPKTLFFSPLLETAAAGTAKLKLKKATKTKIEPYIDKFGKIYKTKGEKGITQVLNEYQNILAEETNEAKKQIGIRNVKVILEELEKRGYIKGFIFDDTTGSFTLIGKGGKIITPPSEPPIAGAYPMELKGAGLIAGLFSGWKEPKEKPKEKPKTFAEEYEKYKPSSPTAEYYASVLRQPPIVSIAQIPIQKQPQPQKQVPKLKQPPAQKQPQVPIVSIAQIPIQKQPQPQKQVPKLKQPQPFPSPYPTPTKPIEKTSFRGLLLPPIIPKFSFSLGRAGISQRPRRKQQKYTPTFGAVLFGAKTTRKQPSGIYTGFERRPLVTEARRRKPRKISLTPKRKRSFKQKFSIAGLRGRR